MREQPPIERRLLSFLKELLDDGTFDLIVCVERKATALLRALIEEISEPRLRWQWSKVLSTASMDQFPWHLFTGRRVLLFEELVHHGKTMGRNKQQLATLVPDGVEITTAGFAVWYRCEAPPDFAFYASVDSEEYSTIRDELIRMLQVHGSLLLDTEHLELSVRLNCDVQEFYHALARSAENGNTSSFLSGADRLNLTVQKPDILQPEILNRYLIPGSTYDAVVRKCRVIEKDYGRFELMPILYPNVRCVIEEEWLRNLPPFVDVVSVKKARPRQLFYLVGLLASIELSRSIVASLGDLLRQQKLVLEVPEYCFQHLSAIFPAIDIAGLWKHVTDVVAESRQQKPLRSAASVTVHDVRNKTLLQMAYFVITQLVLDIDEHEDACFDAPKGRSWAQVADITRRGSDLIGAPDAAWATVPDRLIDSGMLVTNVETVMGSSSNETWAIRTFHPDSEIVTEKLRRQMALRGNKWLPQT
jgi:hypothetical protein